MVARRINEVTDASNKITVSVWKDTDAVKGRHDFQVNVDNDWVCIAGGATGRALTWQGGPDFTTIYTGANYLTGRLTFLLQFQVDI
jgi:hypothetical protein